MRTYIIHAHGLWAKSRMLKLSVVGIENFVVFYIYIYCRDEFSKICLREINDAVNKIT